MKHIAFDLGAESGRAIIGEIKKGKLVMEETHRYKTQRLIVSLGYVLHKKRCAS